MSSVLRSRCLLPSATRRCHGCQLPLESRLALNPAAALGAQAAGGKVVCRHSSPYFFHTLKLVCSTVHYLFRALVP